jgi:hypothetical protein
VKPLQQDQDSRRPVAVDGELLDTSTLFPPLTIVEAAKYGQLKATEEHRLAPEVARVRVVYVEAKVTEMVERKPGMTVAAARQVIERQCEGGLLPDVVLPFDNEELTGCTVADVLADPERFVGATMADPNEGPDHGRLRRQDPAPIRWHGVYSQLRTWPHCLSSEARRCCRPRSDRAGR